MVRSYFLVLMMHQPENLVLDEHFNLKIVDFGLAALIDDLLDADNTTTTNNQVLHSGIGSLPYTAPEVSYNKELYQGKGYKGTSADLWSCAVILYIMLTGSTFRLKLFIFCFQMF
jgi:serine/threonine protein kinase